MGTSKSNLNSCTESLVNGTNDREAHPKVWIAALVQMNCERKSADKLSKIGISNYVPIQEEVHQWSDRRKKITRVVIPMVVFVHVDEIERNIVRDLSFIYKLITYPGQSQPAIIPDSQISQLQFMVDNSKDQVVFKESSLCIGDTIQVIRGPLKWGFINYDGEIVIPTIYKNVSQAFYKGYAKVVTQQGKEITIDELGNEIKNFTPPKPL